MSLTGNPYSESHVKRVFLQHHHSLAPDGNILESKWVVGGLDMTPVERLLPLVTNFFENNGPRLSGSVPRHEVAGRRDGGGTQA
eukprot:jgi/Botrbrau1/15219/Bobra.0149s0074.1